MDGCCNSCHSLSTFRVPPLLFSFSFLFSLNSTQYTPGEEMNGHASYSTVFFYFFFETGFCPKLFCVKRVYIEQGVTDSKCFCFS